MFLLCLYSFISVSWLCCCFFEAFNSALWCWINFFNSFILIWLSFNSFSFSFKINNFFSSSSLLCWSSVSMFWIFSFQLFSDYFLSFSKSLIWPSIYAIISTVTLLEFCPFFAFFLLSSIFVSISLILFCLVIYCSWFFLRTLSFYINLSERTLHSYLVLDSCSFSLTIFSSYSLSFLITFNALVCYFLIRSSPSF